MTARKPDPDGWTPAQRCETRDRLALIRRVHLHDGTPREFIAAFADLLRQGYDPLYGRRFGT